MGEVGVRAIAAREHDGSELCEVGRIGEEACMSRDARHRIVSLLVVDLALDRAGAHASEGDGTVAGIAVKFGRGAVILRKAMLERLVGDM